MKDLWWGNLDKPPEGYLNIPRMLILGQKEIKMKRYEAGRKHVGKVRGGNAGALIDRMSYGGCVRQGHLRYLGGDEELDFTTEIMTKNGEQNEEIWIAELRAAGLNIKDQDTDPMEWEHPQYGKGKGSPDIRIMDDAGEKVIMGLELKNISGFSKVEKCSMGLKPDVAHFIQACNYSLRLGDVQGTPPVPYALCYSSRVDWHVYTLPAKAKEKIIAGNMDLQWMFGKPLKIRPHHRIFYIGWTEDGRAWWQTHGMKEPHVTPLTRQHIDDFYLTTVYQEKVKRLGPRPGGKDLDGKNTFKLCNYCILSDVCDSYEDNYESWVDHALAAYEEHNNSIINLLT